MSGPAPHLDDERLSDLVDGAGSAADRDHVASCAQCSARLAVWRDATAAVSSPPVVRGSDREAAVAAALSRFDAGNPAAGEADGAVPLVDLAERRKRRRAAIATRVAAAAAAVAAIGGIAAVLAQSSGTTNHQSITAPPTSKPFVFGGAAGGAGQGASLAAPPASRVLPDLGEIGSNAQLVASLRTIEVAPTSASAGSTSAGLSYSSQGTIGSSSCPPPSNVNGPLVTEATLHWNGTAARALVYDNGRGHTAVVEANGSCKVLTTVSY